MSASILGMSGLWCGVAVALGLLTIAALPSQADESGAAMQRAMTGGETLALWPGAVPGEKGDIGAEKDTSAPNPKETGDKYVIRLGNVSRPTLTVYRPAKDKDTGAAVVVCPGGGYSILAFDLEGSDICRWLNSVGVTACLLKYRVPRRADLEKHTAPLQDAQRALSMVRHHAGKWKIDPARVGILGFSAGGHLAVMASTAYQTRTYPNIDAIDTENCRPDFAVLIYPAYLTSDKDLTRLAPEINVTGKTSPAFIAQTEDDPVHVENALVYAQALKNAHVPVELHVYPTGGHGYGLRPSPNGIANWPRLATEWLQAQGWLKARP